MIVPEQGLTTTVYTVAPDASVDEAAHLMASRGVGDVIVVNGDKPVGILIGRDLVVRVVAEGLGAGPIPVRDVMSQPLVTVTWSEDISTALALMKSHGIQRLPIVDEEGRLASILTMDDIQLLGLSDQPELAGILRQQLRPQERRDTAPAAMDVRPVEPNTAPTPVVALPETMSVALTGPVASLARPSVVVPMPRIHRPHHRPRKLWRHAVSDWVNRNLFWFVFLLLLTLGATTEYLLTGYLSRLRKNVLRPLPEDCFGDSMMASGVPRKRSYVDRNWRTPTSGAFHLLGRGLHFIGLPTRVSGSFSATCLIWGNPLAEML